MIDRGGWPIRNGGYMYGLSGKELVLRGRGFRKLVVVAVERVFRRCFGN